MVWWGSLVEVYSAINRLHREKEITDLDKQGAAARLRLLSHDGGKSYPAIKFANWRRNRWISFLCGRLTASSSLRP